MSLAMSLKNLGMMIGILWYSIILDLIILDTRLVLEGNNSVKINKFN